MSHAPRAFLAPSLTERWLNRLFGLLVGWGLGLSHNYLVQVAGRKSGRVYSTPVNLLDYRGKQFLVAPRGETQWVRNVRSSGQLWLKKGKRQTFRVRELGDQEKPEILKEYLDRYKTTVQRYFPIPSGSTSAAFAELAPRYPVFELLH